MIWRGLSPKDRFFTHVDQSAGGDGCWPWTGDISAKGYGRFFLQGVRYAAHRWLFEQINGQVSLDMQLDHLCRVRNCVNPAHLEVVTPRENILRCERVRASHCRNGHERTQVNVGIDGRGRRFCRVCKDVRGKMRWKKWRGKLPFECETS